MGARGAWRKAVVAWAVTAALSWGAAVEPCSGAALPGAWRGGGSGWALSGSVGFGLVQSPPDAPSETLLERRLRAGTEKLFRDARWLGRTFYRVLSRSLARWRGWLADALLCCALIVVFGAVDKALVRRWREQGFARAVGAAALAGVVCARLVIDRRAPRLGKLLLLFCVAYGGSPQDLIPDRVAGLGLLDDAVFAALSVRCFVRLCPDDLVQETVLRAASRWRAAEVRRWLTRRATDVTGGV